MTVMGVRRLTVRPGPAPIAILRLYAVGPGIPVLRASDRPSGTYTSKTSGSPAWASVSRERYELDGPTWRRSASHDRDPSEAGLAVRHSQQRGKFTIERVFVFV